MIRIIPALSVLAIFSVSDAETLSFSSHRMEIADGWVYKLESGSDELVKVSHPDEKGMLQLRTLKFPVPVSRDTLRNMTNIDSALPLSWENWGDYSGYQYDYAEGNSFFRQWWLALDSRIVLVVYRSDSLPTELEIELTDEMVNSIQKLNR